MQQDQSMSESNRDSIGGPSSGFSTSDAFSRNYRQINHFNHITQNIQNNNNKITIIIKHDSDGREAQSQLIQPQIIYIQPAATSQPNLHSSEQILIQQNTNYEMYNSLDDVETEEHYQFYDERAVDVPDDFKRNSYLVLNMNDAVNKKLKRRICTPTRTLSPLGGRGGGGGRGIYLPPRQQHKEFLPPPIPNKRVTSVS